MSKATGALQKPVPRIMIAAPHGRSGKTVLTLGLLRALHAQGLEVQPFKKGPDFIDPGWHTAAAGRVSRNLDCFFMSPQQIGSVVYENTVDADIGVIEAAMGLYDGLDVQGSSSSAEIAKLTHTPVILVIDVTRMTRTAAALVLGCQNFDSEVVIAGVILNKVRGERQRKLITETIELYCGIPVVGAVPKDARMEVPDRHLGLVTSSEFSERSLFLDDIAEIVGQSVDIDALKAIALSAGGLEQPVDKVKVRRAAEDLSLVTLAVVLDQAFSFYYPENLIALEKEGARLVYVNSLQDKALPPDIDGLYIGGGFPEVFAEQLQSNQSFKVSVRDAIERDLPVFAECGGLMYLGRRISLGEQSFEMVGALGFDAVMQDKQQAHGYALSVVEGTSCWLQPHTELKGHEHHHSRVVNLDPALHCACRVERGRGVVDGYDGIIHKGVIAGYLHVNAFASPAWAPSFVEAAVRYRADRTLRS
ncbi:MAG: cobyrinate a,c-diamide synthase [Raoultibacter sp.]